MDEDISFRSLGAGDTPAIIEICYRTGYYGEDLTDTDRFNDKTLFGMLAALYYVTFEPENGYVAVDGKSDRVVGYIIGTHDTAGQEKRFSRTMTWRIVLRAIAVTSWRHPESFRTLLHFNRYMSRQPRLQDIHERYRAHLHINILPEFQHRGIGARLLELFEKHIGARGVRGIHLCTSERNVKALPFYRRYGYSIVAEEPPGLWPDAPTVKGIIFAKQLTV